MDDKSLKHDPRNARRHTGRNRELIRQSLEELGAFRSIAVDGDDIIRAGNGVFEQAQELGLKVRVVEAAPDELIAVKRPDLRGAAAERAALYDNRTAELSEWDVDVLSLLQNQEPETIHGVFEPGVLEAMVFEAGQIAEVARETAEERKSNNMAAFIDRDQVRIRPVLVASNLATFEKAIRATGVENRAEALLKLCTFYLENQHDPKTADEG